MEARHDFIKGLFASSAKDTSTSVQKRVTQPVARVEGSTVCPITCLPGLHLTPYELFDGIRYASQMPKKTKGAREFLLCLGAAWGNHFGWDVAPDISEIETALKYGHWKPTLSCLLGTGVFTWDALEFMPEGVVCISWGALDVPRETTRKFRAVFGVCNQEGCSNRLVNDIFVMYEKADVVIQKGAS